MSTNRPAGSSFMERFFVTSATTIVLTTRRRRLTGRPQPAASSRVRQKDAEIGQRPHAGDHRSGDHLRPRTRSNYFEKSFFLLTEMDLTCPSTCVHSWALSAFCVLNSAFPKEPCHDNVNRTALAFPEP